MERQGLLVYEALDQLEHSLLHSCRYSAGLLYECFASVSQWHSFETEAEDALSSQRHTLITEGSFDTRNKC